MLSPTLARAELTPEERQAVDRRLVKVVEESPSLSIEEGDTVLVERREVVSRARFPRTLGDYEGTVAVLGAPRGVVVHNRLEEFRLEPQGDKVSVTLRYAIHVEPGTVAGGRIQLMVALQERSGMVNVLLQTKLAHTVEVKPLRARPEDLTADFQGYRLYKKLASDRLTLLRSRGLRDLALADQGRVPSLERGTPELALATYEFERYRRRTWTAQRHLLAASRSADTKLAQSARAYLDNLDKPDAELTGLPVLAKKGDATAEPAPKVERLKPERVEEVAGGASSAKGGKGDALNPLSTYESGSEADDDEPLEEPGPRREEPATARKPKTPAQPNGQATATTEPSTEAGGAARGEGHSELSADADILEGRAKREIPIPSYGRALVLDDPNIGFAFATRASYAQVTLRGSTAVVPALFYGGQVAITRALGLELTVPTAYVSVDVQRAQGIYTMGNPLLAAKYRFHLPAVDGRRPVLTLRARWGIPISPLNNIPPTQLGAEEFSFPAHFTDTYAFLLEKTDLGLGFSAAWQDGMFFTGLQAGGDYYLAVSNAQDQASFPTVSYGASVGVLPLGKLLGVYLEGRATSLLVGPTRTEFFAYFGARAHFLDHLEVAAWGALPVGSVSKVSALQAGLELRFMYDMPDSIRLGGGGSKVREDLLGE